MRKFWKWVLVLLIISAESFLLQKRRRQFDYSGLHQSPGGCKENRLLFLTLAQEKLSSDSGNEEANVLDVENDEITNGARGNNFLRDERWLESATDKVLDLSNMPLGSLTEDDVTSLAGLMIAWSRRMSVEGAMVVERLLKRIIDDMRAGNRNVHVSTKLYTITIEAWGKSNEDAGAERAQNIHDTMIETFEETNNQRIKPTTKSYNALILAWTKNKTPLAMKAAEAALRQMLTGSNTTEAVQPDAVTCAIMLDMYARKKCDDSVTKSEALIRYMNSVNVKKTNFVYSALQEVYLRSGRKDAAKSTMSVLNKMLHEQAVGGCNIRPNIANFNNVLCAYSRIPSKDSALRAIEMLKRIEASTEDGGYGVDPDRLSYFLTILTCSRCRNRSLGAKLAEPILVRMEERSIAEAKRREQLCSAAPPLVTLDIECFNVVLTAISKSRDSGAADRIFSIISRMEEYADNGQEQLRPTTRTMNTALNGLAVAETENAVQIAERTLDRMFRLHDSGVPNIKPNEFSFSAVLRCYQRLRTPEAAERCNDMLSRMEELYEKGILDVPPDTFHYTIACSTWSMSRSKKAPEKCIELLCRMKEKDKEGRPGVKPNIRTYNAVLDCFSRSSEANKAEELLYHMLSLAKAGDDNAKPDAFSFNAVINAFIYSPRNVIRDAGKRAESILERGLEFAEEDGGEMPSIKSFTSILGFYGRQTTVIDSPYRAQYLLNRLIDLFKAGHAHLSPHVSCFTNVMDAYATQRHKDAGECSEEILRSMIKLDRDYNASRIEVNTGVLNCVLQSWAECIGHNDAGTRAEHILDLMEKKTATGTYIMAPNSRSYNLVIRAWSKAPISKHPDKAKRALAVLERAKNSDLDVHLETIPSEYSYSLVLQACAFSESTDSITEKRAFKIAVDVMDELLHDVPVNRTEPSSATYGWFLLVCARMRLPEEAKEAHIRRMFSRCCKKGRVNEFVLENFKHASSGALFRDLMPEHLRVIASSPDQKEEKDLKALVQLPDLPQSWIVNKTGVAKRGPKQLSS